MNLLQEGQDLISKNFQYFNEEEIFNRSEVINPIIYSINLTNQITSIFETIIQVISSEIDNFKETTLIVMICVVTI